MHLRISRALLATNMRTASALRCILDEQCIALVTSATHTLSNWLADQILTTSTRRDRNEVFFALALDGLLRRSSSGSGSSPCSFGFLLLLGPADRITRTLFAPDVLAFVADFVGAEGGLAAMALAMDAHADWLLNTLDAVRR